MKLSTKGKYGLRAIIDLARFSEKEPVSIGCIATRQKLSERYLEQLFALLKKAGLVKSIGERPEDMCLPVMRQKYR